MKSAILFVCFSGLVMGYDDTCKAKGESCVAPEDEVELMQIRTQVHEHKHSRTTNTEMHEVLASFEEKKGPMALQELMQGLMVLPVLKSEEDMLAAVHSQPQLQLLAKRYPDFMHALGIFEDTKAIPQIKAAVFTLKAHHSPVKMQGQAQGHQPSAAAPARRMPGDTTLLGLSQGPSAIMVWTENYGCTTTLGYTDFPNASMGIQSVQVFGSDCQGYPLISALAVRPEDEGAVFVFANYSMETWETTSTLAFVSETGYEELASLGSSISTSAFSGDALNYIVESGTWMDPSYRLMKATEQGITELIKITDCIFPWGLKSVPGSNSMIWECGKDWSNENDTNKIMKYSVKAGTAEILTENKEYFGWPTFAGSQLYYSMYEDNGKPLEEGHTMLYSCPIAKCDPVKVGELPENTWEFLVTESGEVVTSSWNPWPDTSFNVSVSSLNDLGVSHTLFQIGGTYHLQLVSPPQ